MTKTPRLLCEPCLMAMALILSSSSEIRGQGSNWRGTITFERISEAQHRLSAGSHEAVKEHHILTITVRDGGTAKLHLVYNASRFSHIASRCNGLFNDTTMTDRGEATDTVERDVGQPLLGDNTYSFGGYGPTVPVTRTVTTTGPDPNGCARMLSEEKTETITRQCCGFAVENQPLATSATLLAGSVTQPHNLRCDADSTCSGHDTITWKLGRGKSLSIVDAKLLDRNYLSKNEATAYAPLTALSAAPHTYFNGNTEVYGTIALAGSPDDKIQSVELQVIENGKTAATGTLSASSAHLVGIPFGTTGKISTAKPTHLFDIRSAAFSVVDQKHDGTLALRIRAVSDFGDEATRDLGEVTKLVRYTNPDRYGGRDDREGGDDWLRPRVKEVLEHFATKYPEMKLTWGDMSNMNGGKFSPHASHDQGIDIDGYLGNYSTPKAPVMFTTPGKKFGEVDYEVLIFAAIGLVNLLNDPEYGSEIEMVGVTYYDEIFGDRFARSISHVRLNDGRMARDVIRAWNEHDTHFHLRLRLPPQ
jgi:hypothetical protein